MAGLGGWAMAKLWQGDSHVEKQAERVAASWDEEARSRKAAVDLLGRVEAVLRNYLQAADIEEKAKFVRHAQRVSLLMESHYRRHELVPAQFERIKDLQPFAIEKRPFIYVEARLAGGEVRTLSMEEMPDRALKIDWESEVAYQPMSIEEFVERKPEEAMDFRVYARLDTFYSYEFSDPERYVALLLTERGSEQFLFGYVERGTETEAELTRILEPNIRVPKPVMLRLRFLPETRARRSVQVEKMVSPRWVYAEDPGVAVSTGDPAKSPQNGR
jgi:hypothetical protein